VNNPRGGESERVELLRGTCLRKSIAKLGEKFVTQAAFWWNCKFLKRERLKTATQKLAGGGHLTLRLLVELAEPVELFEAARGRSASYFRIARRILANPYLKVNSFASLFNLFTESRFAPLGNGLGLFRLLSAITDRPASKGERSYSILNPYLPAYDS